MGVRGLSYKQLLVMLLTENLSVVILSSIPAAVVGLLATRGTISALNAFNFFGSPPLVMHMVFPMNSILIIVVSFVSIFTATILPVIVMTKRYSSKLDRTMREI